MPDNESPTEINDTPHVPTGTPDRLDNPDQMGTEPAEQPAEESTERIESGYRSLSWWKERARDYETASLTAATERDQLQHRLESVQRQQVEHLVSAKLHNPADFWRYGPNLNELLNEDGDIDPALVETARMELVRKAPYLAPASAAPTSAVTANDRVELGDNASPTFAELLKGAASGSRGIGR